MAHWTENMRAPARDIRIGGRIISGSGREYALDGDAVFALTIDEGADGMLAPGSVISASCVLDLVNDGGQWLDAGEWTGATIMPELGVGTEDGVLWQPLGVFQAEDAVCIEGEALLRVRASDSISHELSASFHDEAAYPRMLADVWAHALSQTRYLWSGQLPNGDAVIDAAPDWRGATLRAVLGYIACAAGCFVRVGRTGALELVPIWEADAPLHSIDPECYLKLESARRHYGPVDALRLKPVGAEEEQVYCIPGASGLFSLSVSDNPLFRADAPGLDELARGMLEAVSGFEGAALEFEWRGDPLLGVGGRVEITDTAGCMHRGVLTRQTLRFSADGFSASCRCALPEADNCGLRRAITPEGGLNAAALTGAVDGELLRVGSVTANKLAAASVTAEKIAAGALDAITLEAVTAKIERLTASDIATDQLAAALAAFTVVTAGTASFDRATVSHLVAQAMNLEFGVGDDVFIKNLAVEYAQMVGAAIGNLCIKASDGNYYAIDVNENGTVTASRTTVSEGEAAAGQTNAGRVILETSITAQQLNTGNLLATYALVNRIDAARIDVDTLFAREAFIDLLRTSRIVGDKSIMMMVEEQETVSRTFRQEDFPTGEDLVRPNDLLIIPGKNQTYQAVEADGLNLRFLVDGDGNLYCDMDGDPDEYGFEFSDHELYASGLTFTLNADGSMEAPYRWVYVLDGEVAEAQRRLNLYMEMDGDRVSIGRRDPDNPAMVSPSEVRIDETGMAVAVRGRVFSKFESSCARFGNMEIRRPAAAGGLMLDAVGDSVMWRVKR